MTSSFKILNLLLIMKEPCTTPGNKIGLCQSPENCPEINAFFKSRPWNRTQKSLLKASRCDQRSENGDLFCCVEEVKASTIFATPEYIEKLKQKLPQPPSCGGDSQDRIIGGSLTNLLEYPWTVLLGYDKRKIL